MIKAVFIDIDDTLTNSNREVSMKNQEEIKRCVQKGIKIILASGRSRKEAVDFQEKIGSSPYIISSNGASVYDITTKKEIYNEVLKKEIVYKLLQFSNENDYIIKLNYKNELVLNKALYLDEKDKEKTLEELEKIIDFEDIVQCVIASFDIEKMKKLKKYLVENFPETKITNESKRLKNPELKPSKSYFCDITSSAVSKGKAVRKICEYLKISNQEIIVIGDGENDISMFEETTNSVAMRNALDYVKEKAAYITTSNNEDGVARILEKL